MNDPIRPLIHNRFSVVQIHVTDELGTIIESPYRLKEGRNSFRCMATYTDGTTSSYKAVWTCLVMYQRGGYDLFGTFGSQSQEEVTVYASPTHGRYGGLGCWAWTPAEQTPTGNAEIPHYGIGFDYGDIKGNTRLNSYNK